MRCIMFVQVVSDPVGYGFVIRGSRPVYVHAVDPNGPASAAGLKVRQTCALTSPTSATTSLPTSLSLSSFYCHNIHVYSISSGEIYKL